VSNNDVPQSEPLAQPAGAYEGITVKFSCVAKQYKIGSIANVNAVAPDQVKVRVVFLDKSSMTFQIPSSVEQFDRSCDVHRAAGRQMDFSPQRLRNTVFYPHFVPDM
jgi:hypothetical protein